VKAGAAVLAMGAGAALVVAPPAQASDVTFDAVASAYGINNGVSNPSFPVGLVLTGSGPASSAHLTSLGGSDAFASFPYPGDTLVGLPGLASGLFGFSFPNYPLYVATSAGDAPREANFPGIALSSRSESLVTQSRALVGTDVSGFDSNSRVGVDGDGGVTSEASTVFKTLQFGDVFTVSGVRSIAKVVADGTSGTLTRTSELSIGAITVPGMRLVIPKETPGTVPLPVPVPGLGQVPPLTFPPMPIPEGGQTFEAPAIGFTNGVFTMALPGQPGQQYTVPSAPVIKAFADAGMKVTFQQAAVTKNGVIAPAITFETDFPALPENRYYNGATHATYTLGGSFAEVAFNVVDDSTGLNTGLNTVPSTGATGGTAGGLDAAAVPGASAPGLLPSTDQAALGLTPAQALNPTALDTAQRANFVALRSPALVADTQNIYLAVIAVAIGIFVVGTGLRRLGVLRPWTS
jgi:hypothetical protein